MYLEALPDFKTRRPAGATDFESVCLNETVGQSDRDYCSPFYFSHLK